MTSEPAGVEVVSAEALGRRLGRHATGAARDVRYAAALEAGEALRAAAIALWRRRGWVVVATDARLRLARRPRVLGRARACTFDWRDLTAVSAGPQRVALRFGEEEVTLAAVGPHAEFVRLVETARGHEPGGAGKPSVEEIRELARRKLGRFVSFGYEAAIDGLPDRLEPEERVERLAGATLGFSGLLVLTDRRLLLLDITLRRANERVWSVPRAGIRAVEPVEGAGLRVVLEGEDEVTLTGFLPPDRRDEFAAVL